MRPRPISAEHCIVRGEGLRHAVVGRRVTFTIEPRDHLGNALLPSADALGAAPLRWRVSVACRDVPARVPADSPAGAPANAPTDASGGVAGVAVQSDEVHVSVLPDAHGRYQAAYTVHKAGRYTVRVELLAKAPVTAEDEAEAEEEAEAAAGEEAEAAEAAGGGRCVSSQEEWIAVGDGPWDLSVELAGVDCSLCEADVTTAVEAGEVGCVRLRSLLSTPEHLPKHH